MPHSLILAKGAALIDIDRDMGIDRETLSEVGT